MSVDHHDPVAIDAFAEEVDRTLDARRSPSPLWGLIAVWAASGGILTLAQGVDAGCLYPLGLAGAALWAVRLRSYLSGTFGA
jgi:hypothetical protein